MSISRLWQPQGKKKQAYKMLIIALSRSAWRAGILATLFPTLLLLPAFHLHPALEHRHGAEGPHAHPAVVHADFFPSSTSEHLGPHEEQSGAEDLPLTLRPQIGLLTLLSRLVALSIPLLERSLAVLTVQEILASLLCSSPLWGRTPEQRPPIQTFVLSRISPRSPPILL